MSFVKLLQKLILQFYTKNSNVFSYKTKGVALTFCFKLVSILKNDLKTNKLKLREKTKGYYLGFR